MYATGTETHSSQDTGRCQIATQKTSAGQTFAGICWLRRCLDHPSCETINPITFSSFRHWRNRHRSITTGRWSIHASWNTWMMTSSWIWRRRIRHSVVRHQNNVYDGGVGDACISAGMTWMTTPPIISTKYRRTSVHAANQDPHRPLMTN
jgi:hypothetical protein